MMATKMTEEITLLRVQTGSIRSSAEHMCHAGMLGQRAEGREAKHRILMRGCMDVFNSNEMDRGGKSNERMHGRV